MANWIEDNAKCSVYIAILASTLLFCIVLLLGCAVFVCPIESSSKDTSFFFFDKSEVLLH